MSWNCGNAKKVPEVVSNLEPCVLDKLNTIFVLNKSSKSNEFQTENIDMRPKRRNRPVLDNLFSD